MRPLKEVSRTLCDLVLVIPLCVGYVKKKKKKKFKKNSLDSSQNSCIVICKGVHPSTPLVMGPW